MGTPNQVFAIILAIYFLSNKSTGAQRLTAELCSAKLPTTRALISPLYDGDDTIYLFGGYNWLWINQTLKYSISEDRIESAGHVPVFHNKGAAVMNKFKNIFFFDGGDHMEIYQYFPASQTFQNMSSLAARHVRQTFVKANEDSALLFGIFNDMNVTSLNLNTLESEIVGSHPSGFWPWGTFPEAIWSEERKLAYIFTPNDILTYSQANNQFVSLGKRLPIRNRTDGVSDGRYFYLFGEMDNGTGLILFDPEDDEMRYIEVENKPSLHDLAPVYVENLNRIYIFGGGRRVGSGNYSADIYYISLDPIHELPTPESQPGTTMDRDIFNCLGRADASYPYPGDCTKFVSCREDHGYQFNCPEPQLFNPVERQCTWPDWVDCNEDVQI